MVIASAFLADCSGLIHIGHPKLPFCIQRYSETRFKDYNTVPVISKRKARTRIQYVLGERFGTKYSMSVRRNEQELSFADDVPEEPFWLSLIKEALWALKSLFLFLVEQPSQLKYIEWPSFQSTLKTATLTLVLVALLIVALSSIDSCLSYLLALFLRRTP
ncbi:hypothetical protein L1049_015712 [Liquidambar formosana]|uniref:Uncharacterized protein n=1 Tax=Liquidambar formosana TaxID=63359 RepID=A0AAP0S4K7_LIQFO